MQLFGDARKCLRVISLSTRKYDDDESLVCATIEPHNWLAMRSDTSACLLIGATPSVRNQTHIRLAVRLCILAKHNDSALQFASALERQIVRALTRHNHYVYDRWLVLAGSRRRLRALRNHESAEIYI